MAGKGYNIAKLIRFSPVTDVVPYLLRRAEENSSVEGQTKRELVLLNGEIDRRNGEVQNETDSSLNMFKMNTQQYHYNL